MLMKIFHVFFRDTNRKSWLVPACLSTKKSNMHVKYRAWGSIGAIVDHKVLLKNLSQPSIERAHIIMVIVNDKLANVFAAIYGVYSP